MHACVVCVACCGCTRFVAGTHECGLAIVVLMVIGHEHRELRACVHVRAHSVYFPSLPLINRGPHGMLDVGCRPGGVFVQQGMNMDNGYRHCN